MIKKKDKIMTYINIDTKNKVNLFKTVQKLRKKDCFYLKSNKRNFIVVFQICFYRTICQIKK